jgi:N-acetylmuramoyl-L-alanine amidase
MIGTSQVRLCAAAALILLFHTATLSARDSAKTLYDKALKLEQQLKSSTKLQGQLSQWKQVTDAFRTVYYKYPSSGYCDNALFHVGSLYAEMGERFRDPLYFRRACSSYEFLIQQYSSSSLVQEAMLEYIRIQRNELDNAVDAQTMEAKLKARWPKAALALTTISPPAKSNDSSDPAVLSSLRHYTGPDYTRVVIDLSKEVSVKRNRLANPDRLYLDFENTTVKRALLQQNLPVDDGFLKQIRVGQNTEKKARVVLDLKSIETYDIFPLYHPYRIIVDIQGKKVAQESAPALPEQPVAPPEMAKTNTNGRYSLARQLGLKVGRIILDPGHGGHDPGAMYGRLREKDITLDVAHKLKSILEEEGYVVLMTRSHDKYVPLEERTAFANGNSADLFVSVHVNSSRNRRARGIETYYLNFATTVEAMEVAARENAITGKNMAELQKLTTAIALNSKIEESREFAQLIQKNLISHLEKPYAIPNLGVKQAPFYVLIGAQMPSILAEISFLSNQQESVLLEKPSYRQSIAEGLAGGIKRYVETLAEDKLTQNRRAAAPR